MSMADSPYLGIPPDFALSPQTGWTRAHWAALADHLLLSARTYATSGHARICPPGAPGGYGHDVDGLEGFARTFLMAGFRIAGDPAHTQNLAAWYAQGIEEGVTKSSAERWVRPDEHPQAKVEAASLALILDMTRPQIWARLSPAAQAGVIDYLAPVVGDDTYPRNNWLWFRIVVETFLRSVGGPWRQQDIDADLALHDSFRRAGGWLSDGDFRSFDHYTGWALHLYPTLWQRMSGARDLATDERRASDRAALCSYLGDALHLVGADGGPLIQGRSLIYRFASAAPFWVGALAGVDIDPGLLRRAASGIVKHFIDHGVTDTGLLSMGWFGPCRGMAQSYSGPGSPYWAAKAMLGLALPPTHPAWLAVEQPLPVEQADFVRAIEAPVWAVSGTKADGIVRAANHGTDHALPGELAGDSPLYAALGYSTATAPFMGPAAYETPLSQYAALVGPDGRLTHRAGFICIGCGIGDALVWAASREQAHWMVFDSDQVNHGSGLTGQAEPAGVLTVISILRGPWECRLVHIDHLFEDVTALRVAGWAVEGVANQEPASAITAVECAGLTPPSQSGVEVLDALNPLGTKSSVPYVSFPARCGEWSASVLTLGAGQPTTCRQLAVSALAGGWQVAITWPDGRPTVTAITDSGVGYPQPATTSKGQK